MPNRIIKESIWTSPNLNELSDQAEKCFYRLLLASDDWGCFDANPLVIKGKCFPLQLTTDTTSIMNSIKELEKNEIIRIWQVGNRTYGQFVKFEQHNPLLQKHEPTTPCPPWMLDENNFDTRLASETLQAFHRIAIAIETLNKNSHKPTYKEICDGAKCSPSTLSKYYKYAQTEGNNTSDYTSLQPTTLTTDTTDKNPNHNPNHNPILYIYTHWNSKNIINHQKLTDKISRKCKTALRDYSLEDIKKAIDNYAEVMSHPEKYYWTYKWGLSDFLQRGLDRFMDNATPLSNFLKNKNGNNGKTANDIGKVPTEEELIRQAKEKGVL